MNYRHSFLLPCLVMTGCFSLGDLAQDPPTKHQYLLSAVAKPMSASGSKAREAAASDLPTLHVNKVFVAAPFHEKSLVYRIAENEYTTDYYEEFLVSPSQRITQLTVDWLRKSGTWPQAHQGGLATAGRVLDLTVLALYGDYRNPGQQQAVLRLRAELSSLGVDGKSSSILEKDYDARVEIEDRQAATLVAGMNRALEEALGKLATDLRSHRP